MEETGEVDQGKAKEEEANQQCCCMCGDVGFSADLRRCPACRSRLQHTYCSGMYPKIEAASWRCEWCLHQDRSQKPHSPAASAGKLSHDRRRPRPSSVEQQSRLPATRRARRRRGGDADDATGGGGGEDNEEVTAKSGVRGPGKWNGSGCGELPSTPRVAGRRYKLLADVLC